MGTNKRTIKSVENAIALIDAIEAQDGATVTELADKVDLTKGTVHTYLATLQRVGYVERTERGEYRLGLMLFHLGTRLRDRLDIYNYGKEEVDELARTTGDVTHIAVEADGLIYLLYSTRGGQRSLKSPTPSGEIIPAHASATGKAILAMLPRDRVDEILDQQGLERLTTHTITDRSTLFEELDATRERGYANNVEEQAIGARTVAMCVQRPDGTSAGAVGISGTVGRFDDKDEDELIRTLSETTNQIEINIQQAVG